MSEKSFLERVKTWLPFGKVDELSPAQVNELIESGNVQLLDVRTKTEWDSFHIEGATHVPIHSFATALESLELDKERTIVAICRSAHRSVPAVRVLRENGYENSVQLQGGMLEWQRWLKSNE